MHTTESTVSTPASPAPSAERSRSGRAKRRLRRRAERRQRYDDAWLADALSEGPEGRARRARAWIRAVADVVGAVERVAWEVRDLADTAARAARAANPERRRSRDEAEGAPRSRRSRAARAASGQEGEQPQDAASAADDAEGLGPLEKYRRLASTAWMLVRVAGTYRLHELRRAFMSRQDAREALEELHEKNSQRFYTTSVEQGGAFLKVGQLLSSRRDLLPEAWSENLAKLQDEVPAMRPEQVHAVIERELGAPVSELFESFSPEPIAAASIGQVHRAVLRDGSVVAVKVQRPGIGELMELDLQLLELFLETVRSMLPPVDFDTIAAEIRATVTRETDYVLEGQMMDHIADFFAGREGIVVPHTVAEFSRAAVLTSNFVEGRKITVVLDELVAARDAGDTRAAERLGSIMGRLLEAYVQQILEAGVFQADPHPGNLLVGPSDELVVLDFGAATPMPKPTRDRYLLLVRAFLLGDEPEAVRLLDELGFRTRSGKPDTLLLFARAMLGELRAALTSGGKPVFPSKEEMLERAAELLHQTERDPVIKLPPEFVMIGRVFAALGGLFGHYDADIDYARVLMPIVGRAMSTRSVAVAADVDAA